MLIVPDLEIQGVRLRLIPIRDSSLTENSCSIFYSIPRRDDTHSRVELTIEMTRTLHSSDSDTSSSHSSSKRRMRSLETPNVLAALEDTITLRDPNIVLPQRSLERHRRLQKLLQW